MSTFQSLLTSKTEKDMVSGPHMSSFGGGAGTLTQSFGFGGSQPGQQRNLFSQGLGMGRSMTPNPTGGGLQSLFAATQNLSSAQPQSAQQLSPGSRQPLYNNAGQAGTGSHGQAPLSNLFGQQPQVSYGSGSSFAPQAGLYSTGSSTQSRFGQQPPGSANNLFSSSATRGDSLLQRMPGDANDPFNSMASANKLHNFNFPTNSFNKFFSGDVGGSGSNFILTESDFPTITAMGKSSGGFGLMSSTNMSSGNRPPAGFGLMRNTNAAVSESQNEFQINVDDFPALPVVKDAPTPVAAAVQGASANQTPVAASQASIVPPTVLLQQQTNNSNSQGPQDGVNVGQPRPQSQVPLALGSEASKDLRPDSNVGTTPKQGIQTSIDGLVTNIPPGMIRDQFGMVGLLAFLRAVEQDASIVQLAVGHDLTTLGLNLNAPDKNLFQTFSGPLGELPCRPHEIDVIVPTEYVTNSSIREKLAPIKLNRYQEDLLFFLFYTMCGELYQVAAAIELYHRDWRYHKDERVWLTRCPGMPPSERTNQYERGTYYVWDPTQWRKITKEMLLEYDKLEERPVLPNTTTAVGGQPLPPPHPSAAAGAPPTNT